MSVTAKRNEVVQQHLKILFLSSLASRFLVILLVVLSSYLPAFDTSHELINASSLSRPLLRWDAFHFAQVADQGYKYEYEWAFFFGIPTVMRLVRWLRADPTLSSILFWGSLAAAACDSTSTLYHLTLHHFRSPSLAFLASLLSLLPSSPATLKFACYSEPFFALSSYKGMLACARKEWWRATLLFAIASCFRSNGILLAHFIVWGLVVQPFYERRRLPSLHTILRTAAMTATIFSPFLYHQYTAYLAFCRPHGSPDSPAANATPAWCHRFPPSIYTYVQATYWNAGLFKYWTLSQLPNFLLAAPVYALLLSHTYTHLLSVMRARPPHAQPPLSLTTSALLPHAVHALLLTGILLCASHVQIVLRLASSMPFVYWAAAARLLADHDDGEDSNSDGKKRFPRESRERWRWGYMWVWWSVVWGAVSVVLWTVFLPPA